MIYLCAKLVKRFYPQLAKIWLILYINKLRINLIIRLWVTLKPIIIYSIQYRNTYHYPNPL